MARSPAQGRTADDPHPQAAHRGTGWHNRERSLLHEPCAPSRLRCSRCVERRRRQERLLPDRTLRPHQARRWPDRAHTPGRLLPGAERVPELKYEEEGVPGISHFQELIQRTTGRPAAEMLRFQRMLIFHYLIGNADAHAKNYALLHRGKVPDLAQDDRLSFSTDRAARRRALLRFFAWASNLPHLRDLSCPNYSR